jgi:Leucine-rich repeat (LRR) protein
LERLSLDDNNFPAQDLEIFTPFQELKLLRISGIRKPSYFYGSLKPLQKLEKLELLNISGTDITHSLEYLPDSVKELYCNPYRSDAKVIDLYEELQPFENDITK